MPNLFGARTDHFGLTDTGEALEGIANVIESSKVPMAQNRGDAQDENGDIAASAYYGNTAGNLYQISNTYQLKSGQTLNLNTLKLGELTAGTSNDGVIASEVTADTINSDLPTITFTGIYGADAIESPTGFENTFTLPSISITGAKRAQTLQFTTDEGKLTSSSFTASIEISDAQDGEGEIIAHGVSGGTMEISADFVGITTAPAWTVTGDFTETQAPGEEEPQADWETGSGTAAGILSRDETVV